MNTPDHSADEERVFLHNMCNAMAVLQGSAHLLLMKTKKNPAELKADDVIARVEKMLSSIEKINNLVSERRDLVRSKLSE